MTDEETIRILMTMKSEMILAFDHDRKVALDKAIEALRSSAELISWLDECIGDEHTTPIERATLMAVKCKVEGFVYAGNIRPDKQTGSNRLVGALSSVHRSKGE
jgi:hypothetical protein